MVNKKAVSTLMLVFEVLIVLLVVFTSFQIAARYANSETTSKINIAEDIRMMVDTLVGTPGESTVQYPADVSKYTFILNANSITVFIKGEQEQKWVSRYFSLPQGYDAFGTLEGKADLCINKEKRRIILRGCNLVKKEELPTSTSVPAVVPTIKGPSFYGIPIEGEKVIFVVDRSESMAEYADTSNWQFSQALPELVQKTPTKNNFARWQLKLALQEMPDGKYVNIILFNDEISDKTIFNPKGMTELNPPSREQAFSFIDSLQPSSGTDLFEALQRALSFEGVDEIIVLTDGASKDSGISSSEIADKINAANTNKVKIKTVGFFSKAPADEKLQEEFTKEKAEALVLLKQLAEESGGVLVTPGE